MNKYYVYVVKEGDNVLYVGHGTGTRYLHPTSGRSHVKGLNRLYFQGVDLIVEIVHDNLSKEEARIVESSTIRELNPSLNIVGVSYRNSQEDEVNISLDVLVDQRLEYFDRCLLMYMSFRFNCKVKEGRSYFESTQTLADVFGVHRNTVSRAIQRLKEAGYLTLTSKTGRSNTYTNITTSLREIPIDTTIPIN